MFITPHQLRESSRYIVNTFALRALMLLLATALVVGCSSPEQQAWQKFEDAKSMDTLESQVLALQTLREIETSYPDSLHKGTSVQLWIEQWESTVEVYQERERTNEPG